MDHSVQVDFFGSAQALRLNLEMEFKRNRERYRFLKWGQQAFETFGVVRLGSASSIRSISSNLAKGVLSATHQRAPFIIRTLLSAQTRTRP